uniref:PORR domain-containing protein n=2 Tax=Opuntia streptacantha TaxID=393608 RepID=A0A7C9EL66_OPUST
MLLNPRIHKIITQLYPPIRINFPSIPNFGVRDFVQQWASISSLKVHWRKDQLLDRAIQDDKRWRLCARVVKEVLNEPGRVMPLRYLEKRRARLRLNVRARTFIEQNPVLFDTYFDRISPKSELITFIRPSDSLLRFLEEEKRIYVLNEPLIVAKLCKLLMMSKNKVISAEKLIHVKREFGFPNDFLSNLVPRYPKYFRLVGNSVENSFLELVSWEPDFARSVIMARAEQEERLTGIRVRPSFNWKLPPGFFIKKEMREWVRDWMEMPYINPYDNASHLDPASREMEKRMVGVLHELLSLSLFKRIPVPILGKFTEDYRFSNAFSSAFTRHSGIFYMSLKGGIQTAVLREAYKDGVLIDQDPLLEMKDIFVELLEEGWKLRAEELRLRREVVRKHRELMPLKNQELQFQSSDEELSSGEEKMW